MENKYLEQVVDLTHPEKNIIYNMSSAEAVEKVKSGNIEAVRKIDGNFALVSIEGKTIRLARSIGRPLRYFIAKLAAGPCLIIGERIDTIYKYLVEYLYISALTHGWGSSNEVIEYYGEG